MPTSTPRLELVKPLTTEPYDVGVHNGNMDLIDGAPANLTICTSSTRPSSPDDGDGIYETDSGNVFWRQSGAWRAANGKWFICTSSTRPASGLTYGGLGIYETDTGNRLIRNAANSAWIPQSPYWVADVTGRTAVGTVPEGFTIFRGDRDWYEYRDAAGTWRVVGPAICSSTSDRDTAITHPHTGLIAVVPSLHQEYIYDSSNAWVPVGNIASRIMTSAGVQYTTSGTTELDMAKLRIENYRVKNGFWYTFTMKLSAQFGAGGDSFLFRVRKDTALSGTVVANFEWIGQVAGFTHTITMDLPWQASADDTDADFYFSVQRIGGSNVLSVNGANSSSTRLRDEGADGGIWAGVA